MTHSNNLITYCCSHAVQFDFVLFRFAHIVEPPIKCQCASTVLPRATEKINAEKVVKSICVNVLCHRVGSISPSISLFFKIENNRISTKLIIQKIWVNYWQYFWVNLYNFFVRQWKSHLGAKKSAIFCLYFCLKMDIFVYLQFIIYFSFGKNVKNKKKKCWQIETENEMLYSLCFIIKDRINRDTFIASCLKKINMPSRQWRNELGKKIPKRKIILDAFMVWWWPNVILLHTETRR